GARRARAGVAACTTRRVAEGAATSPPAVYELFGDKAGLVREMFFEGFRMLRRRFDQVRGVAETVRGFVRDTPVLAELMFSRPFADFDPGPSGTEAGSSVREFVVGRV